MFEKNALVKRLSISSELQFFCSQNFLNIERCEKKLQLSETKEIWLKMLCQQIEISFIYFLFSVRQKIFRLCCHKMYRFKIIQQWINQ